MKTAAFERPESEEVFGLESNIRALVPHYAFQCSGRVTEWQAYVVTQGTYSIEFQVWRPFPDADNSYNRVGSNYFPDVANASQLLILPVQQREERIAVRPGDIVGFSVHSSEEELSFELNTEEDVYIHVYEENVDPGTDLDNYDYGSGSGYVGAPLIKAVVKIKPGEKHWIM